MGHQYTSCCSTNDCLSAGHVAGAEYAEVNYFQLSSEDVDLVGTNQLLQNALVKSDQIEITGDLGEGTFGTFGINVYSCKAEAMKWSYFSIWHACDFIFPSWKGSGRYSLKLL